MPSKDADAGLQVTMIERHDWLDPSRAPLYVVTYPAVRAPEDVKHAHEAIESVYRRAAGPVAWLVDARSVRGANATERQIVVEHEKRVAPFARKYCAGLGLVIPNAIVRGLFTAVTWMAPLQYPFKVVDTCAEAELWLQGRLIAAGGGPAAR
jgi:hypothetical protein